MKTLINTIASFYNISTNLQNSIFGKLFLFIKLVLSFLYWKLICMKIVNLKFIYVNKKFNFHIDNRVDLAALDEIFVHKEYEFLYAGEPKVILDLGANIGDTAIFYALKFPNAKIFAVEPNPHVHQKLLKNTKQFSNIMVCKCAVSDKTGKINLNFGDSHLGSSINMREQNKNSIEVDVFSLKDFCKKEGIEKVDILKFDIEGAEEYLLQDAEYINENVSQMVGEMHDDLVTSQLDILLNKINLKNTEKKILSAKRYILYGQIVK